MVNPGSPLEMWTSTETGHPTAPLSAADATVASMRENGRIGRAVGSRIFCRSLGEIAGRYGKTRGKSIESGAGEDAQRRQVRYSWHDAAAGRAVAEVHLDRDRAANLSGQDWPPAMTLGRSP